MNSNVISLSLTVIVVRHEFSRPNINFLLYPHLYIVLLFKYIFLKYNYSLDNGDTLTTMGLDDFNSLFSTVGP